MSARSCPPPRADLHKPSAATAIPRSEHGPSNQPFEPRFVWCAARLQVSVSLKFKWNDVSSMVLAFRIPIKFCVRVGHWFVHGGPLAVWCVQKGGSSPLSTIEVGAKRKYWTVFSCRVTRKSWLCSTWSPAECGVKYFGAASPQTYVLPYFPECVTEGRAKGKMALGVGLGGARHSSWI